MAVKLALATTSSGHGDSSFLKHFLAILIWNRRYSPRLHPSEKSKRRVIKNYSVNHRFVHNGQDFHQQVDNSELCWHLRHEELQQSLKENAFSSRVNSLSTSEDLTVVNEHVAIPKSCHGVTYLNCILRITSKCLPFVPFSNFLISTQATNRTHDLGVPI